MITVQIKIVGVKEITYKHTTQHRPYGTGNTPDHTNKSKILATVSVAGGQCVPRKLLMYNLAYLMLNRSLMQMFDKMISPPPPMPWMTLPPISIFTLMLKADIRDPPRKIMLARSRTGLRPQMSLNLPHVGVDAAAAKRYAELIHV